MLRAAVLMHPVLPSEIAFSAGRKRAGMLVILAALILAVGAFATFIACAIRDEWRAEHAHSARKESRPTMDQAGPSRTNDPLRLHPESLPAYPLPDKYRAYEATARHVSPK